MSANDVMLWMSAKGEGTWSRYRTALDELTVTNSSDDPLEDVSEDVPEAGGLPQYRKLKLNLERLAHAEFFRRDFQNGWRVVPPTIVVLPNGDGRRGVLCGARSDPLLSRLTHLLGQEKILIDPQSECPDRIILDTNSPKELSEVARAGNLVLQDGGIKRLLTTTPPIDNYQLRIGAELPFGEDWQVSRFSPSKLKWTESSIGEARSRGFGLFKIRARFRPEYFMKLQGKPYKLPVQVGKYIVLSRAHREVLSYDYQKRILSMPVICRPPLLLDRALTLCTGLIPQIVDGRLEYPCIEPRHFSAVRRILRQ